MRLVCDVFGGGAAHHGEMIAHGARRAFAIAAQDRFDHRVMFAPRGGEAPEQVELGAAERRESR